MAARVFLPGELALAAFLAGGVELGLVGVFITAGQNRARVVAHESRAHRKKFRSRSSQCSTSSRCSSSAAKRSK